MQFWRLPIPFVARHLPSRACNSDDFPYLWSLDTIHLEHRQLFMTNRPVRVSPPEFGWKSTSARVSPKPAIPRVKKNIAPRPYDRAPTIKTIDDWWMSVAHKGEATTLPPHGRMMLTLDHGEYRSTGTASSEWQPCPIHHISHMIGRITHPAQRRSKCVVCEPPS